MIRQQVYDGVNSGPAMQPEPELDPFPRLTLAEYPPSQPPLGDDQALGPMRLAVQAAEDATAGAPCCRAREELQQVRKACSIT